MYVSKLNSKRQFHPTFLNRVAQISSDIASISPHIRTVIYSGSYVSFQTFNSLKDHSAYLNNVLNRSNGSITSRDIDRLYMLSRRFEPIHNDINYQTDPFLWACCYSIINLISSLHSDYYLLLGVNPDS